MKQYLGKTTGPSSYYGSLPIIDLELSEYLDEFNRIQRKLIQFSFNFRLTKAPDRDGYAPFHDHLHERGRRGADRNDRADYGAQIVR